MSRLGTLGILAVVALGVGATLPTGAIAAERIVFAEDFTATWCVYCPYAGRALHMMGTNFPNTFTYLQIHEQDSYNIPWGTNRQSYYGIAGYPTVWFDGKIKCEGAYQNDTQQYNWYLAQYNTRRNVATDVSIQLGGELVSGTTYRITARVSMDANGTPKTVRVYILHALDFYPYSSDFRYRMCLRPPAPTQSPWWVQDVPLTPGMVFDVVRDFTFDSISMGQTWNIRMIAWAQKPASSGGGGAGELWNVRQMNWPFQPLPPVNDPGDLNCDGVIDFGDIDPFVLAISDPAAYAVQYPNCDVMLADCNGDGLVNFDDVNAFVDLLSGG